jgi:heme/copper-type cytochrome/quinol oxidase subunit 2
VTAALFWLAVAVATVAELAIVAATVRVSRPHGPVDVPALAEGETSTLPSPRRWLELVWAVIPALALAALFVFTWRSMSAPTAAAVGAEGAAVPASAGLNHR